MSNKKRRFARIATGVLTVLLLLWSGGLYTLSFMPWWIPVLIGIAFAVVTISAGMKMWRSVLNVNGRIALILIHVLVAGSIGAFAVVGGNYYGAPESSARDVDAIVIGKHSEKRNRYRTLRRRRVKTGEYQAYYVDLLLPDSLYTKRQINVGEYTKIRMGQVRHIGMRDGFWGYPVIRN